MAETEHLFLCHICRSPFRRKSDRDRHEKRAHMHVEGKSKNCPECRVLFSNSVAVRYHLRDCHGTVGRVELPKDDEYTHKCKKCQTPFKSAWQCSRHEHRAHRQVKGQSVNCLECSLIFSHQNAYLYHRKHVHKEGGNANIDISIARTEPNRTRSGSGSGTRSGSGSENRVSSRDSARFSCRICGKTYTAKHNCADHIVKKHASHTREGPANFLEEVISPNYSRSLFQDLGDNNLREQKELFDSTFPTP